MKITFILPGAGMAGGVRVVATYAELLHQRGHEVTVVCLPPPPPKGWRQRARQLVTLQLFNSRDQQPEQSHFDNKSVKPHILAQCRPIMADDVPDADIVVATWWETAEWVAEFPPAKGAKVYLVQHDETVFAQQPRERVRATWRLPMHKVVIAQWLADLLHTECQRGEVSLIPNSVDTQQFFAPARGKQPTPTVGVMYTDIHWKGCDVSLEAVSLALRNVPELQLVAFGFTPPAQVSLPPGARYIRNPAQAEMKDIYAQCDAWLFGSRVEGFGLPILEAMSCHTPVIGTPAGAAPELLDEGAGILVKPEDPESMAKAIERVCQMSDQEWRTMSDLAYCKATSYTWEDATDLFEAVLYRVIEQSAEALAEQIKHKKRLYSDSVSE
jgi:glycosyltransferase involved in cell wall biosynthesis